MSIRFSIITATRAANGDHLRWHQSQTSAECELLVVSNDGAGSLGDAYNEGLAQAQGTYCCFIHDDVEVVSPNWLQQLAAVLESQPYDLIGVAGANIMPSNGVWWGGSPETRRGQVWHRQPDGRLQHDQFGDPDHDGLSPAVTLDGLLLFGRRWQFVAEPFDTSLLDGFHFYDADLCLRWLTRRHWQPAVYHQLKVIHNSGGSLKDIHRHQQRFLQRFGGFLPLTLDHVAIWRQNLAALRLVDRRSAAILTGHRVPGKVQHIVRESEAGPLLGLLADRDVVLSDPPAATLMTPSVPPLLFGCGDGERLQQLLATPPYLPLRLIEPEAHQLLHLLSRHRLDGALMSGRLRLRIVVNDQLLLREISLQQLTAELQEESRRQPPQPFESGSTALNSELFKVLRQAPQRLQQVAASLPPVEDEFRFDIAIISPRCAIFHDLAAQFKVLGVRCRLYNVPDRSSGWREERQQLLQQLRREPARLVLMRNRSLQEEEDPRHRLPLEDLVPGRLMSWWWDVPNIASWIDLESDSTAAPALAFARDLLPLLPAGSIWLPPGARSSFLDTDPISGDEPQPVTLSFVGQSRYRLLRDNLKQLTEGLSYIGGRAGVQFGRDLERRHTAAEVYHYLQHQQAELQALLSACSEAWTMPIYYLDYLLKMSLTGAFRIAAVEQIVAAGLPIEIYGDEGWRTGDVVGDAHLRGVIEPAELGGLYRRSRLNLNFNFMQVSSTVNPKVLDIAAAGGAVLTDYRPELEWLYPDPACRPFHFNRLDELPDMIATLLTRDITPQRQAIQHHTWQHHTLRRRAAWLIEQFGINRET